MCLRLGTDGLYCVTKGNICFCTLVLSLRGFVKGEGLRLLRTNSSEETFVENIRLFKLRLGARGYPHNLIDKTLSEVKFSERKKALKDNARMEEMEESKLEPAII